MEMMCKNYTGLAFVITGMIDSSTGFPIGSTIFRVWCFRLPLPFTPLLISVLPSDAPVHPVHQITKFVNGNS